METNKNESVSENIVRVCTDTNVTKLAASIFHFYKDAPDTPITLLSVGPSAVNQAVKGLIIANKTFVKSGKIASFLPSFRYIGDAKEITAVAMTVKVNSL